MGIKGFSKAFEAAKKCQLKDFGGQTLFIDAMAEICRCLYGMKKVNSLTNIRGQSTVYLNSIYYVILKFKLAKISQVWCFDYDSTKDKSADFHNPAKQKEIIRRMKLRQKARQEHQALKEKKSALQKKQELFSDSDTESDSDLEPECDVDDVVKMNDMKKNKAVNDRKNTIDEIKKLEKKINLCEKRSTGLSKYMINNVKLMLNYFEVPWVEAPKGIEGECLAAKLTHENNLINGDAVYSPDSDVVMFRGKNLIRRLPRSDSLAVYNLTSLLAKYKITHDQLLQVGCILGGDFYHDEKKLFRGIGPKTAIKKLKSGVLDSKLEDPDVVSAINEFKCTVDLSKVSLHNAGSKPFTNKKKANGLIDWLVESQGFKRERIEKAMLRAYK
jgi:hypothetical protein